MGGFDGKMAQIRGFFVIKCVFFDIKWVLLIGKWPKLGVFDIKCVFFDIKRVFFCYKMGVFDGKWVF
jgi:hypothetical protein